MLDPVDSDVAYRALCARDRRFDGVFFTGVSTTGIYCRPVCPARTPGKDRCAFFASAALAERAGYRACLRCRPERAPGQLASVDRTSALALEASRRIEEGALDHGSIRTLAEELGVTDRHLRRVTERELGVSPIELAQSRRLALARALVDQGTLTLAQVAFAAGFQSVRRFNAAYRERFGAPPSVLPRADRAAAVRLTLGYRPPYDFGALLSYLGERAIDGLERVEGASYERLVVGPSGQAGRITVTNDAERSALVVTVDTRLTPDLRWLVPRVRTMFDVDTAPDVIARTLGTLARGAPGLRVPGCLEPFELAVRAVLGQQVSVRGATTLAKRLVDRFGESHEGGRAFPTASALSRAGAPALAAVGLTGARARTLHELARRAARGELSIACAPHPASIAAVTRALLTIDGIGPWTSAYIAVRALRDPDAFMPGDLGVRKALGGGTAISEREAARLGEPYRPFRAYAVLHLWRRLSDPTKQKAKKR